MGDTDRQDQDDEFEKHRSRFFGLIGHCVTNYQFVEDYLGTVFAAGLGISEAKAVKILDTVRGLGTKLQLIAVAISDADEPLQTQWQSLSKRIGASADARNQIAHARPTSAGRAAIILGPGGSLPGRVQVIEAQHMELRKKTGTGETIWTTERMSEEYHRMTKLFRHLTAFKKRLQGEDVPPHLEEP